MTKEEISVLGHAFFDGKTLQSFTSEGWKDYSYNSCPDLNTGVAWRIKPEKPKTITICAFVTQYGSVTKAVMNSAKFHEFEAESHWTHIKSLDQVVDVE